MWNAAELQTLGIDTEEGLACCAEDPEFYGEMLEEYAAEARSRAEELRACRETEDWKRYGILAHSVKSTSHMIGALALSEQARELELAAKEGAGESVRLLHGAFLAAYETLAEGIRTALGLSPGR